MRGKASYADQVFLIKRGLLKHLLQIICSKEIKSKEVLQSSFDLLGELMKFNHVAFKEFTLMISEIEVHINSEQKKHLDTHLLMSLVYFIVGNIYYGYDK